MAALFPDLDDPFGPGRSIISVQPGSVGTADPDENDLPLPNTLPHGDPPGSRDFGALFDAGLRRESTFFSAKHRMEQQAIIASMHLTDEGFDPYQGSYLKGYERFVNAFVGINNRAHADMIKYQIDDELRDLDILTNSGALGYLAMLTGALLDPSILIPFGKTKTVIGLVSMEETIRQATQVTRSGEEAFFTVGATTMLAGLVRLGRSKGPFGGRFSDAEFEDASGGAPGQLLLAGPQKRLPGPSSGDGRQLSTIEDTFNTHLREVRETEEAAARNAEQTVGASAIGKGAPKLTEAEELAEETMLPAAGLEKIPDNPLKRMMLSDDVEVRRLGPAMVDNPYFLNKHKQGITQPHSVESLIRRWQHPLAESVINMRRLYDVYRGGQGSSRVRDNLRRGLEDTIRGRGEYLSQVDWQREVGRATHEGDMHPVSTVQEAAQFNRKIYELMRKELMEEDVFALPIIRQIEKLKKKLEEAPVKGNPREVRRLDLAIAEREALVEQLRIEGPQVTNADSYGPIFYRGDLIIENYPRFQNILREYFREQGLSGAELELRVKEVSAQILRFKPFVPIDPDESIGSARSLKERSLDIPVRELYEFIELDAEVMLRYYMRTMSVDLELTRRFGDYTMADEMVGIRDRAQVKIEAATTAKERKRLVKQQHDNLRDARGIRDRLRGTFGLPDDPYRGFSRFVRAAKQFQYLTGLGGVVISSIPDLAMIVMTEGFERAFRDAFMPLVKHLDGLKLTTKEGRIAGVALEMELGLRAQAFTEIGDMFGRSSSFERGLTGASSVFSYINLFNPWNSLMKGMASGVIGARIIEDSMVISNPLRTARQTKIEIVKGLTSQRTGKPLGSRYNRKTNTIFLDEEQVRRTFREGVWFEGQAPPPSHKDVNPLPDGLIRNIGEWREFVMLHELAHADFPNTAGLRLADHENRINRIATNRMMAQRLNRGQELSSFGREKLARAGIDDLMAERIASQWEEFGGFHEEKGATLLLPNTEDWIDIDAQEAFRAALGADVDRTIITPGAGDRPLFFSYELGSLMFQFKSFSMASAQRILIPGLQRRDGQVIMGLAALVGLGMIVDEIKRQQFGQGNRPSGLTERLVNGIDRSGVTGYFGDLNRLLERVSDNQLGMAPMLGIAPPYRPSFRSKFGAILGPTAGQMANVADIMTDTLSGEYDYRTAGALRRLLPGQNVLWLKPIYDTIELGARF